MYFQIRDEPLGGSGRLVALAGEVDIYAAPQLKHLLRELVAEGKRRLVVDLTETTFIDSTALGVLVGAHQRVRPEGGVELIVPHGNVRRVLEITQLDRVFVIRRSREDALSAAAV